MIKSNQNNHDISCAAGMAEGLFRGAILGTVWGSVASLELVESAILKDAELDAIEKSKTSALSLAKRRAHVIFYSTRGFSVFFAAYSLGSCLGSDIFYQKRDSPISSLCGGFCGGFALSALAKPFNFNFCITTGLATGFVAGSAILIQNSMRGNKNYFL